MSNISVDATDSFWNQMRNKIAWSAQGSQTHEKVTVQGIKGNDELVRQNMNFMFGMTVSSTKYKGEQGFTCQQCKSSSLFVFSLLIVLLSHILEDRALLRQLSLRLPDWPARVTRPFVFSPFLTSAPSQWWVSESFPTMWFHLVDWLVDYQGTL